MKRSVVLLAALFVLAACGADDGAPSSSGPIEPPVSESELDGSWVFVGGPVDPIPGRDVTVTIDGDRISGTAACNGYGGTIEYGDGELRVGDLSWTEMGCEPDVQALEQSFLTSLSAIDAYRLDGDRLVLIGEGEEWRFDPAAPVPTAALVGTTWILDTLLDGDTASNVPGMERATLRLDPDGTLSGSTGCRELTGQWTESGSEIVFTRFSADGDCSDEFRALDDAVIAVLGDGFRPEVDGSRLTVTSRGGDGLSYIASTS